MNEDKKYYTKQIEKIKKDIDHFMKHKSFNNILTRIGRELLEKDIYEEILDQSIKIEGKEDIKEKIGKQIEAFIHKNSIKYIKKIKTEDYTIEEYEKYFLLYINNKKIDIEQTCQELFKGKKIINIEIDGFNRKKIEKLREDFKYAKRIKIKIEK